MLLGNCVELWETMIAAMKLGADVAGGLQAGPAAQVRRSPQDQQRKIRRVDLRAASGEMWSRAATRGTPEKDFTGQGANSEGKN